MAPGLLQPFGMSADTALLSPPSCETDAARKSRPIVLTTPGLGCLWFGGWLFTIGFAHLSFWKAVLGLVIWPYFLGVLAR